VKLAYVLVLLVSFSAVIGGMIQGGSFGWLFTAWLTALAVGFSGGYVFGAFMERESALEFVRQLGRRETDRMVAAGKLYRCPLCGRTTPNPHDIEYEHCPCCGMPGLPNRCEHDPDGSRQMARIHNGLYRPKGVPDDR